MQEPFYGGFVLRRAIMLKQRLCGCTMWEMDCDWYWVMQSFSDT